MRVWQFVCFALVQSALVQADTWIWAEPLGTAPQPRFQHSANRIGSKLYVFGGTLSNEAIESDMHVLDTDTFKWASPQAQGNLPGPTTGHSSVAFKHLIYVMFGSDGKTMMNRVFNFNTKTSVWTRVITQGRVPSPRSYHSSVITDNQIYTFGGYDGRFYLNDLHTMSIDPQTNQEGPWQKLEQKGVIPEVRASPATAVYGRQMYLFGGFEVAVYKNDFFVLNLDTLSWSRVSLNTATSCPMPGPRALASMTLMGSNLVLFGGIYCSSNGTCTHLNDVHQFDVYKSEFTSKDAQGVLPPARYGHSSTLIGSKALVFGGAAWPNLYNDMFFYDVYDNTWTIAEGTPPYARKQHTLDTFVDEFNHTNLIVFGGKHGSGGFSNHVHFFDTETGVWKHPHPEGIEMESIGHHASTVRDNTLYVFGGYNGTHSSNRVFSYDLDSSTWEPVDVDGHIPPPCHGHSLVIGSGEWYQFGGVDCIGDNCTFFNDIHALNFETLSWSTVQTMGSAPRPRASHSMTSISPTTHLLFGGIGAYFTNFNDLYMFDEPTKSWSFIDTLGSKPPARFAHTSQAHRGKLLVFGGASCRAIGDCVYYNDLHMFIPATRVWIKLSIQGTYPAPRFGSASVMIGEVVYIHGGASKDRMFGELLTVEPDASEAANTVVYGEGSSHGTAGGGIRFYVQPQDSYHVNRTTGGDNVTVVITPTSHKAITKLQSHPASVKVTDQRNGLYQVDFLTQYVDAYNITVQVNNVQARQLQTIVIANQAHPNTSLAHGSGLSRCTAGEECEFNIEVFDVYGNKLERKSFIDVNFVGPRRVMKKIKDNGDGNHKVKYVPEKSGNYNISVRIGGHDIPSSPFHLHVSAAAASSKRVRTSGSGLQGTIAGELGVVHLTLFDQYDNPITNGGDKIKAVLNGPDSLECAVDDHNNGSYSLSYAAIRIGTYQLSITLNDDNVEGSPYQLKVTNAPMSPTSTFAYGSGLRRSLTGYRAYFTIQGADDFGNNMTSGGANLNVLFAGPGESKQQCNITDHGDGKYTASYLTTIAGDFMISATIWNKVLGYQSIHLSPFLGFTLASGADPLKSFLYVEDSSKPLNTDAPPFHAVMGVHNFFRVQAVDRYGNKKTTGGDMFTGELEGPVTHPISIVDNGDGTYTGVYVAPASGRFWLKVFYGNIALKGTPIAVIVQSNFDACPNKCSGHGDCRGTECVCTVGYSGPDCSIESGNCPLNCMGNGACLNNTCFCYPGFTGPSCDDLTTLCKNDCSKHGECIDALCVCDEGYQGPDCSDNAAMCPDGCGGNGECVDGKCLCYPGFKGLNCGEKAKFCPKGCSGRGSCTTSGMCSCHFGWTGLDCGNQIMDASTLTQSSSSSSEKEGSGSVSSSSSSSNSLQPELPARLPRH